MTGINIYGENPLLGRNPYSDPEILKAQQEYMAKLEALTNQKNYVSQPQGSKNPIWDKIDEEIATLTDMQKQALFESQEYQEASADVNTVLQNIFLATMKPQVENNPEGKELLQRQYDIVKKLKKSVVETTNKEMEMFRKWQDFSAKNPNATYQEFLTVNK